MKQEVDPITVPPPKKKQYILCVRLKTTTTQCTYVQFEEGFQSRFKFKRFISSHFHHHAVGYLSTAWTKILLHSRVFRML